ncbi:cell wall endo-beta-1,3-glucanase [Scheffersomyces coipomensis]|uniref:cell wall endo-beta-1,3-glucanase n=1 Tax=Scheffersomyces coipomensis TaxID=1788519 RepID=UPI00315DBAC4
MSNSHHHHQDQSEITGQGTTSRKTTGGSGYFFNNLLKRSNTATTNNNPKAKLVPLDPYKLTRSKSANYFRDITGSNVTLDTQNFPDLKKISSPGKPNNIISPSLFNETLLSTAGPSATPSPERYPSVVITKPQILNTADLQLDAVSPLTGETMNINDEHNNNRLHIEADDIETTVIYQQQHQQQQQQQVGSAYTEFSQEEYDGRTNDDETSIPLSSAGLNKLKLNHNSLTKRSVFEEILTPVNPKDLEEGSKIESSEYIEKSSADNKVRKHIVLECFLILLILLILGGFIPALVYLSHGTEDMVKNFFNSEAKRDLFFPYLTEKYGDFRTYNPNIVNTPGGLSPLYRDDPKILALMEGYGEPIFHGLAYSPMEALEPSCGINKTETIYDLVKLSTVTSRIRNYGMQCNQSDFILDSIQSLNLNMTLAMGIWIGKNDKVNRNQLNTMKYIVKKYPQSMFDSIFIGNEVLFREDKSSNQLIEYIKETKKFLKSIGYKKIPVGTSEIGSLLNKDLFEECDIVGANIHPYFTGNSVEGASNWTLEFLEYQMEPLNYKNKTIIVSEVGWPTDGGNFRRSVANIPNFKYFISDYICKMKNVNYGWYYFEAFDEPWKKVFYEGKNRWETSWGLFNSDRSNKLNLRKLSIC